MEVKSDKNFELNADIDKVWKVLINPKKVSPYFIPTIAAKESEILITSKEIIAIFSSKIKIRKANGRMKFMIQNFLLLPNLNT